MLTIIITFSECQTDEDDRMLRSMLLERLELDVRLLEKNKVLQECQHLVLNTKG